MNGDGGVRRGSGVALLCVRGEWDRDEWGQKLGPRI